MRDFVLIAVVLGSLPLILRRPWIGVLVFSWISYMNPHRLTWGIAYDMPFAAMAAATTIVALPFCKDDKSVPLTPLTILWLLFLVHISVTTFFAINSEDAFNQWEQVLKIQVMAFVTIMLMKDRKRLDLLIWVIALSIGFYGVKGGVFSLTGGLENRVWGPPGGFFEGNNELALALIMIIPLMYYLYTEHPNKWVKRGLLASMMLCGVSIIGSYSRGAFIAGSVMALTLAWQTRYRFTVLALVAVAAVAATSFLPEKWLDRMGTIQNYEQDGSAMGRINAWYFAVNVANDRPLTGGGFDTFTAELFRQYAPEPDDYHDSHSIYFGTLGEHGYVGLGLFLLIGLFALIKNGSIRRRAAKSEETQWAYRLSSMLRVSLIGYAVGGLFLGLQYFDLYYHLVAITLIVDALVKQTAPNIGGRSVKSAGRNDRAPAEPSAAYSRY